MRPSVRQLEYLTAVADERHFGRAATRSAITQPALSAQIALLEESLGVQLLERSRRGVIVTEVGRDVVDRARRVLEALDALVASAQGAREPFAVPIHMGVIPTVAPYLLPHWLPHVRRAHPTLELYLHEDQTLRILQALQEGRLDLLLLALPIDTASLVTRPLYRERFVLVAHARHPLMTMRRKHVRDEDLVDLPVLLLEDGHCLRDQALSVCQMAGARESDTVRASSLTTLVQMVANGLGITLLPESAVKVELRGQRDIAYRSFRAPQPTREIGLVWRAASGRAGEFERLAALLAKHLPTPTI